MLRKILSIIFSLPILACGVSAPEKPVITLCLLDSPRLEGICQKTDHSDEQHRVPIAKLHKSEVIPAEDYKKLKDYIDELIEYVIELERNQCD